MTDLRAQGKGTPEGLCTKCSATQYCDEHRPFPADESAQETRTPECVSYADPHDFKRGLE